MRLVLLECTHDIGRVANLHMSLRQAKSLGLRFKTQPCLQGLSEEMLGRVVEIRACTLPPAVPRAI